MLNELQLQSAYSKKKPESLELTSPQQVFSPNFQYNERLDLTVATQRPVLMRSGEIDDAMLEELSTKLDQLLNYRPLMKKPSSGGDFGRAVTFRATPLVVIFLEHTIKQWKPIGTSNEKTETFKPNITNWAVFKQTLFEILDHRLFWAPEISGAVNTSYLGLDEHLLIFML